MSAVVVFVVDASPKVGHGHITRSRHLAAVLKERGDRCVMIAPEDYRRPEDVGLFQGWMVSDRDDAPVARAERTVEVAGRFGARAVYVDDYDLGDEAAQRVLLDAGLRWMQQFDGSKLRPYWCDVLINGSPAEELRAFADRLEKPGAKPWLGPEYSILRPEFPPALRPDDRPLERVLVTFGGGDDRGCVVATLGALLPVAPDDVSFVVMCGSRNPRRAEIERWIAEQGAGRVTIEIDPPRVAELFASCDLAVTAGGTTTSEAAACGLPMLLFAIEPNQINQCRGWEARGAAIFAGDLSVPGAPFGTTDMIRFRAKDLADAFAALHADDARRAAMSAAGRTAVDGKGAIRVAEELERLAA